MQPPDNWVEESHRRRRKRCYHRVISGLEKGGDLRLITLTSSDEAPPDIQRSFRKLLMRLRRRHLCQDYIKVVEVKLDGRQHIHLCYRGKFIDQCYLSALWKIIHLSPVVDIRKVKGGNRNKRGVAGYLAKYMSKEMSRRYSWSWGWVYKGFVKTWQAAKTMIFSRVPQSKKTQCWLGLLALWRSHLRGKTDPELFLAFINEQVSMVSKCHLYQTS